MSTTSSDNDNTSSRGNDAAFVLPPNPHRQRYTDNSMGDFMNNLLMHRKPIDWSAIVLIGKSHHNLGHNALHLACTGDDPDIRAPSVHVVRKMLNVCGRQAVESVDKKDGRTLLHRAVVCVQEDLANYKLEDDDEEDSECDANHEAASRKDDDDDGDDSMVDTTNATESTATPPTMTKEIPLLQSESLLVEIARLRQRYRKKWSSATTTHPSLYFCDIAAALLEYSDTGGTSTPELHQDDNGHTPLHVALKMCPSTPLPPPPSSKSSSLPPLQFHSLERFHLIATLVSRCKNKGGLLLQDLKGHTPLHHCILDRLGGHIPRVSRSIPPMAMEIVLTEACPEAIATANDKGMTPLHLIASKVPCRIVMNDNNNNSPGGPSESQRKHIWNLFHHLVKLRPQALRMRDYDRGYTPLHYAVMNDAEGAVVESILRAEREGYQMLSEEGSRQSPAAMVRDRSGFTALHLACFDRAENRVVKALLEHAPESALMRDDKGYTPLQRMWHSQVYWFCIIYEMLRRGRTSRLSVDFFAKIVLFLKAMDPPPAGRDEAEWNVIHAAAASNAPTPVLHIALHMEPNKAFEMNERGELPLHSACASPIVPFPTPLLPYNEEDDDDLVLPDVFRLTNIQTLLHVDPLASMVPNSQGRFPLHLAILAGKPWSYGIRDILSAAPHFLSTPDPVTGLYPFMMAATVGTTYDAARETVTHVQDQLEQKRQEAEEVERQALAAEEESAKAWKNREKKMEADRVALERWRVAGEVFDEVEGLKRELKMATATVNLELTWINNTYKLLQALPALIEQAI